MKTRSGLFESSDQQIAAELGWLELIIKREIAKIRRSRAQHEKFDEFSGLYVSEADVDAYLAEAGGDQDHAVLDPDIVQIEGRDFQQLFLGVSRHGAEGTADLQEASRAAIFHDLVDHHTVVNAVKK